MTTLRRVCPGVSLDAEGNGRFEPAVILRHGGIEPTPETVGEFSRAMAVLLQAGAANAPLVGKIDGLDRRVLRLAGEAMDAAAAALKASFH